MRTDIPENEDSGRSRAPLLHEVQEFEGSVQQAISSGQMLTAIEVARDALRRFGGGLKLKQQLALSLAQTGALDAAREVLGELMLESARDEETLCLLGRVNKELWRRANDPAAAAEALQQACKFYGDAFALNESYYPGINLAFALAAAGELDRSAAIAAKVAKACRVQLANEKRSGEPPNGWLLATLAEALTHQGNTAEAAKYYEQAAAQFAGRWRDLASMRRQAAEVLDFDRRRTEAARGRWFGLGALGRNAREIFGIRKRGIDWLDQCFKFPVVVVFSGHMMDRPDRSVARFPAGREAAVREQILAYLREVRPGFGYSSLSCGGDIIFCECLMELGAKVHLVLPCPVNTFKRQSVSFGGAGWEERFHRVLGLAHTFLVANPAEFAASDTDDASAMGLVYANRILTGLAALQAQALDFELKALALWDGGPPDGPGGTATVIAEWRARGLIPHIISPAAAPAAAAESAAALVAPVASAGAFGQEIKAIVLFEVINYQQIAERQIPAFVNNFRGAVARLLEKQGAAPAAIEGWGSSHFLVYDDLEDAALFALGLRDLATRTDWVAQGLPAGLGVRMVLHGGPLFSFSDPLLHRPTCVGSHLLRATRIQPITPPGQVYVTQEFAALCAAEGVTTVNFEYLGSLRTAKLFEEAPLFRLDHRRGLKD